MPAKDRYVNYSGSAIGPAVMMRIVTPHDTNELDYVTNGLLIGGAGTLSVVARDDTDPVTITVVAGQTVPVRAKLVRATGTTATGIVALIS